MNKAKRITSFSSHAAILKLLSDDEIARVSTAESAGHLPAGEEYIDLEQLEQGVQRALGASTPMGRVIPKSALRAATWRGILGQLAEIRATLQTRSLLGARRASSQIASEVSRVQPHKAN